MKLICSFLLVFISIVWSAVNLLVKSNGELDPTAVTNHILHLEQTLADLQTQNQAQEQKQAAVLSSVLSKLASTSDELLRLKTDLQTLENEHNFTLLELAGYKTQLDSVITELKRSRENHTNTLFQLNLLTTKVNILNGTSEEIVQMKTNLEQSVIPIQRNLTTALELLETDVEWITGNMSDSNKSEGKPSPFVAFEVKQKKHPITVDNDGVLRFDNVSLNIGDGYHADSGVFEVPVSGTYLFWANIKGVKSGNLYIHLVKGGHVIFKSFGTSNLKSDSVATLMYITQIQQGDKVWFRLKENSTVQINGFDYSGYGAAMLHADWQ